MCITQTRKPVLSTVEQTHAPVISEINSEKEYEIVKSSDTEEGELSENQKNKILIHSDSVREKSPLYTVYLEKL